ncbi:MAG TPA: hypothetical protein VIH15_14225 [Casimicrobiaceae bacterium]|jgi:hypothetical protein
MRISALVDLVRRIAVGALALLAVPCALALSLGDATPQSAIGQPLRVVVPIGAAPGQVPSAACVHVIADAAGASGPPRLLTGRVTIDRSAAEPLLVVTTSRPVNDPVVRLAVQAGCDGTTRRDYVLLLDPPTANAIATSAPVHRAAETMAVATPEPGTHGPSAVIAAAARAPAPAATREPDVPATAPVPAAAEVARQPTILLSSPTGSSFIPEASAAGLPRASAAQPALTPVAAEPVLAPWWPLGAALVVVGALALWLLPSRRRQALEAPAWIAPTARTEPNHSVPSGPTSRTFGRAGHFAAMTEPGPGFPRGATTTTRPAGKPEPAAQAEPPEDPRFAEFDADLVEERTIRAEWAKAVNDGAIDIGGDSILQAIDAAEREIQGGPVPPAQAALDRSLDDELLRHKARR